MPLSYRLDAEDRVVALGGAWNRMSWENGGPDDASSNVLDHSLWRFISDPAMSGFLRQVFQLSRDTGQAATLDYRCDAPGLLRYYRMIVTPKPDGILVVDHEPLVEALACTSIRLPPGESAVRICGQCNRVALKGWHWRRFPALPRPRDLPRKVVLCDDCRNPSRDPADASASTRP